MHRVLLSVLVVVASLLAVPAGAQTSATAPAASAAPAMATVPTARKKRIAVFDFDYATVMSASQAYFGQNIDLGKGITDLLVRDLVKDGTYSSSSARPWPRFWPNRIFPTVIAPIPIRQPRLENFSASMPSSWAPSLSSAMTTRIRAIAVGAEDGPEPRWAAFTKGE